MAVDKATGRRFQFKVTDPALLRRLEIGEPVVADFNAKTVATKSGSSKSRPSLIKPGGPLGDTSQPSDGGGNDTRSGPVVAGQVLRNPGPENPGGDDDFVFCRTITNIRMPAVNR